MNPEIQTHKSSRTTSNYSRNESLTGMAGALIAFASIFAPLWEMKANGTSVMVHLYSMPVFAAAVVIPALLTLFFSRKGMFGALWITGGILLLVWLVVYNLGHSAGARYNAAHPGQNVVIVDSWGGTVLGISVLVVLGAAAKFLWSGAVKQNPTPPLNPEGSWYNIMIAQINSRSFIKPWPNLAIILRPSHGSWFLSSITKQKPARFR